jgi:hypothetical protein
MRATISFNTLIVEILSDTAAMLRKRAESYKRIDTQVMAEKIIGQIEYAEPNQLPAILESIGDLRTHLASFDYALEDTMKILTGYHAALTTPPNSSEFSSTEEPPTNNEI